MTADNELNLRSAIRDSWLRVHDFGADNFTADHDVVYASRDLVSNSVREIRTCRTSKLVDNWSTDLQVCNNLLTKIESWNKSLRGPSDLNLGFDRRWPDLPANFLPDHWCTMQNILSNSVWEKDKYWIMVFLATLSYSQHADEELIHTFLAFATVQELKLAQPANTACFNSHKAMSTRERN
jgi:hypothetical protein